ncbi:DUF3021 family protein [Acetivibrio mesophilus]|uniref:DUF3021 family protein n=1 Tax=Acetivibrio mesophilus TaxID=2487273 RepID=A0A4Q0I966_9FIRM|nr:DUF3021 family protein [Acetivibrio mesophilus]RXE60587.1 DUF3021 family protein [Acetivibrio mesophilus]
MIERIKTLFIQMLMISTGILFIISVEGVTYHLLGEEFSLDWYHPLSVLVAGFVCAIPTLLLMNYGEWSRKIFIIKLIIHMFLLYGIVVLMGYIFSWYTRWDGFLFVTIGYFLVYLFVWIASIWIGKQDEKKINKALEAIRDEE